jgi:hypothetical protein
MMTTPYERLKVAWSATDRRKAMNREVEDMAAEGVSLAELDAALERMLLDVRAAGVDDETEEEILGIGDRLHGWVMESSRIHTKTVTIPDVAATSPTAPVPTPIS